jgi:hypothetical protein
VAFSGVAILVIVVAAIAFIVLLFVVAVVVVNMFLQFYDCWFWCSLYV